VPRFPVPEFPVPEFAVPGIPVLGVLVPEGRAALAATRRVGRNRERLTAGWFRSPAPAWARMAAARTAATRAAPARGARRGRDGRGRRAAPEHRAATARGAGPHHAEGPPAIAPRPGEAAGPPGTEHVAGHRGSRRAGSLAGQKGYQPRRARAAGRHRLVGRPHLASSAPGMTWAAEPARPGLTVVPSRRLARGPGSLRPGIRGAVERYPCGPRRAAPRSSRHELRQVVRREKRRPPPAAGRPREHLRTPGVSWSPEDRQTRETWPRPRSPACARRGERRSGHLANTRSSASAPVRAPGPARGTRPPGAGDQRAGGGATFRPG
jgi:hypothetical protein